MSLVNKHPALVLYLIGVWSTRTEAHQDNVLGASQAEVHTTLEVHANCRTHLHVGNDIAGLESKSQTEWIIRPPVIERVLASFFHRRSTLVQFASGEYLVDPSLELLEQYGLVADEDSFRVLEFDRKRAFKLHRELWELVFSQQQERLSDSTLTDPFSFMASASMRGHSTCSSPFCRLQKLDFLARYTALYANKVLFPLPLSHPSKVDTVAESRDELAQTALILLRLRRLIDAGMVVPVVMRSTLCTHVIRWVRDMTSLIHEIADDATLEIQKHFRVMYQSAEKAPTDN